MDLNLLPVLVCGGALVFGGAYFPIYSRVIASLLDAKEIGNHQMVRTWQGVINEFKKMDPAVNYHILIHGAGFPNVCGLVGRHLHIFILIHKDIFSNLNASELKTIMAFYGEKRKSQQFSIENFNVLALSLLGSFFRAIPAKDPLNYWWSYMEVVGRILLRPLISLSRSLSSNKALNNEVLQKIILNNELSSAYLSLNAKIKTLLDKTLLGLQDLQGISQVSIVDPISELDLLEFSSENLSHDLVVKKFWEVRR